MSILQGFEMLNSAIRGIRDNNMRHDERMAALKLQKDQLSYQVNDPRNRLARMQAEKELEPGILDFGDIGKFNTDKEREHFNRYTVPAIKDILPSGVTLDENNKPVYENSNTAVELPAFQRRAIKTQVAMSTIASRLGHNELDMEIDTLNNQIAQQKKDISTYGEAKQKLTRPMLMAKEEKLATLMEKRSNPQEQLKRLMTTNSELSKIYKNALMNPDIGQEFYGKINKIHELNNAEIKNLLSTNDNLKDAAKVTYHYKNPSNGEIMTRDVYMPKAVAASAPTSKNFGDHVFTLGGISNVEKPSDKEGKSLTDPQKNTILKDFTKFKTILSAAQIDVSQEDQIEKRLRSSGESEERVKELMEMIKNNATNVQKEYSDLINNYKLRYGNAGWFTDKSSPKTNANMNDNDPLMTLKTQLERNRKKK